ncbi:MAG: hypothetical protein PVI03_03225 [Candidatus Thorarchaeota archaeon]|jgi:hypothetical protein
MKFIEVIETDKYGVGETTIYINLDSIDAFRQVFAEQHEEDPIPKDPIPLTLVAVGSTVLTLKEDLKTFLARLDHE